MISILLLYALCASTFTICKAVLAYSKPLFFMGIRMSAAGIILLAYWIVRYGWNSLAPKRSWYDFVPIILFHIYFAYVLDIWSLQYLSSAESSFIYNLSPLLTALFSYLIFTERMTPKKWIGLSIGLLGLTPEVFGLGCDSLRCGLPLIPTLALVGAVISAAYGWTTMRSLIIYQGYSPIVINGIGMMGGGLLALLTSAFTEQWYITPPVTEMVPFIKLTALIIVIANIIFYNLYGHLLAQYTATFLSFAGFVTPFFAALFGWFFLGEQITATFIISLVIVSVGLYIFYQEELKQGYMLRRSAIET